MKWGSGSFLPSGLEKDHPYVPPVRHPFKTNVPLWVQAGDSEVLHDEISTFVRDMKSIYTNKVGSFEVENAPHDILLGANVSGFVVDAVAAANTARRFIEYHGFVLTATHITTSMC